MSIKVKADDQTLHDLKAVYMQQDGKLVTVAEYIDGVCVVHVPELFAHVLAESIKQDRILIDGSMTVKYK